MIKNFVLVTGKLLISSSPPRQKMLTKKVLKIFQFKVSWIYRINLKKIFLSFQNIFFQNKVHYCSFYVKMFSKKKENEKKKLYVDRKNI
jgi:hypothetical protein